MKNFTTLIKASILVTTKKMKITNVRTSEKIKKPYFLISIYKLKPFIVIIVIVDNPLNIIFGKIFIFKIYLKNKGKGQKIKNKAINLCKDVLKIAAIIQNNITGEANLSPYTIKK